MDIEFDENDMLTYKGIYTGISREQMFDLQSNHAIDITNYLEEMYKKSLVYIRDQKIDLILRK